MLNTWTLTALGEMDSSLAMSRWPLPAATSRSTSGHSIAKARLGRWLAARNRPMMEATGKESHR